jgi:hypothetical protein
MGLLPSVLGITATCGRMQCLRRSLSMFLDQDYEGEHTMLIFNNSKEIQTLELPQLPDNKHVILINNSVNSITGKPYSSLGEIYNDILNFIPSRIEVVYHQDDDDLFLSDHISKGIEGYMRCGKLAYKPRFSWFYHEKGIQLMGNNLEPSIFINTQFLKEQGYFPDKNVSHHLKWLGELQRSNQICVDQEGKPTFIYTWGIDPVFKTSGAGETLNNFNNYREYSKDFGDSVIHPIPVTMYKYILDSIKS